MAIEQEKTQKTALGYLRISDKKQIQGESIANQKAAIEGYARTNNIQVIKWFKDEAKSGKNADREELQKLLSTALRMKGQIDYVIVYKMSRASRDVESYITGIRSILASRGIKVRSATEPFDDSPMGKFTETLYISVAELENNIKREMVVDNMTRIAQQGFWQHKPPRGYERCTLTNEEGQPRPSIQPNHEAANVTAVLMRWNRGDITEAELSRYATMLGFVGVNGKPLNQDVLHKILINPVYAGYVCCKLTNYQRVPGRHKGLITPEVFEQNQLIYKMKDKDYLLGLKHQKTNELYPLRRFVRCVRCNEFMTACKPKNSPRYFCYRPSCAKSGSVMTKILHNQFEELLKTITPSKGTTRLLKEVLKRQVNKELGGINQNLKRVRNSLDTNDAYRQKILNKFINDKITEADKDLAMCGVNDERLALKTELAELEQNQTISEDNIEYALNFMADISTRWHDAPLELKQTYQRLVFPEGFVYDIKNQKIITPDISPLYRVIQTETRAISTKNFSLVTSRGIEPLLPG